MKIEVLKKAWEMRQQGIYTMREIANKLGVDRYQLITELNAWIKERNLTSG